MDFLYLLERIRVPVLNEFMLAVTTLGSEIPFLVIGLIVFWCIDKRKGYYVMSVGFLGTMINGVMKLAFRIPRPWVRDPNFTILEAARDGAGGYSFPSGHTQTAVGTFGSIAVFVRNKWIRAISILMAVLVGFSRMYIGVHTPADVLVAAACAIVLIFVLKKPVLEGGTREMKAVFVTMLFASLSFLMYVHFGNFPVDMDANNMASGLKNAYTMFGCTVGMAIVYVADTKWLNFSVQAKPSIQLIKIVAGLLLVLAVKEGMRAPLERILPVYPARALRYFLIVLTAGILWPMSFKYLTKLGEKK